MEKTELDKLMQEVGHLCSDPEHGWVCDMFQTELKGSEQFQGGADSDDLPPLPKDY